MILKTLLLVSAVIFLLPVPTEQDTFENVTISGYSLFRKKFDRNITQSTRLEKYLPSDGFDKIEIVDQYVPVLYENAVSEIENLNELIIQNVQLQEIRPGAFNHLPQLRILSLKYNKLEKIVNGTFNYLPLFTLDLRGNKLSTIEPTALNDLPNLLNINLDDNLIKRWDPEWFLDTPLLSKVSMSNNLLEKIPNYAFINLQGDKVYGSADLTVKLVFSHNKIVEISHNAFKGLTKINQLFLDHNLLSNFNGGLLKNTEVKHLKLNHNKFTCFQGKWELIFKGATTDIDNNELECQCLEKIRKLAENGKKHVVMTNAKLSCDAEKMNANWEALVKKLF